ncbi:MAG: divergent polysaccharide deacetylase family protein [Geminicoccaceae bacterium]
MAKPRLPALPALPRRVRRLAIGAGVGAAAIVGLVAAAAALPAGKVRYVGPPPMIVPITAPAPPAADIPEPEVPARLSLVEPDVGQGPPATPDPNLLEHTPDGIVPRVAKDGVRPLARYARPVDRGCQKACVAVLVTGLGLIDRQGQRALALPAPVALSFSPYSDASGWQARARAAGHEVLLGLPVQPARSRDDAGPLTVRADLPSDAAISTLRHVLAQGSGYVALDGEAGAFAASAESFLPLARELQERGLGLIEIGGDRLAVSARTAGLAHASAIPVDLVPMPEAIDRALAEIAAMAMRDGRALAATGPSPATLERLAAWIAGLPARGIELVPPSRFLLDEPAPALARQ